ncbi:MAG: carboxypeptidase-like regulatory domain-containing protein, partial [Planctomycetales bacterium]|nr:carboxypeptidase-like regulatory domain-containing protein [Planctomycetales bacterium]
TPAAPRAAPPALVPTVTLVLGTIEPEGPRLEVRVVRPDGSPAAGARVALAAEHGDPASVEIADEDGYVGFRDVVPENVLLTATAGAAAAREILDMRSAAASGGQRARRLLLAPAAGIEGRVTAPGSSDVPGATVRAWPLLPGEKGWDVPGGRTESPLDSAGRFRLEGLAPGRYGLLVRAAAGLALEADAVTVELASGQTATLDLRLAPGATLLGSVASAETGDPLPGARVEVVSAAAARRRTAWTDDRGRYEVPGLAPGVAYDVRVLPPVHAFETLETVRLSAGETREIAHRLSAAGVLDVLAPAGGLLAVRHAGSDRIALEVRARARGPGSALAAVTIPGLAAGEWDLVGLDGGSAIVLARFTVRAFETTFVDAGDAPRGR